MNKLLQLSCNVLNGFCVLGIAYIIFVLSADAEQKTTQTIIPINPPIETTILAPIDAIEPEPIIVNRFSVEELECLALNIYHEARGESTEGQEAVAWVTLNRVMHEDYPDTICGVVKQARYSKWWKKEHGKLVPLKNKCHFSWYCDGKSDTPREQMQWEVAQSIAFYITTVYGSDKDPTKGAIMYHASYVNPYWADAYTKVASIGTHIFYVEPI